MLSVFIVKLMLAILVCRTMSRYEKGVVSVPLQRQMWVKSV